MILLQQIKPNLHLKESVAVVASSADLTKQKNGPVIDAFDEVVRFNRAPTEGWEEYTGSKTTLRVVNNHVFSNVKHRIDGTNNPDHWKGAGQPQYFIKNLKNQRILLINKDVSEWEKKDKHVDKTSTAYLGEHAEIQGFGECYNPSVGYLFLSLCIMNGIKPVLFGFGVNENINQSSHYWEDKVKIAPSHTVHAERLSILKWEKQENLQIK